MYDSVILPGIRGLSTYLHTFSVKSKPDFAASNFGVTDHDLVQMKTSWAAMTDYTQLDKIIINGRHFLQNFNFC